MKFILFSPFNYNLIFWIKKISFQIKIDYNTSKHHISEIQNTVLVLSYKNILAYYKKQSL
ncbi:hypothetical protein C671_2986 [[Clostridium] bifermentans ATCC 19299]|nr:hypothetical protein C671_2986 [[Clostridium] bifermentans ATCC 19299] [Paraclostridium bifermentans ATCC 19299]